MVIIIKKIINVFVPGIGLGGTDAVGGAAVVTDMRRKGDNMACVERVCVWGGEADFRPMRSQACIMHCMLKRSN